MAIRAVVTDIEGTTSSLAFVSETLFPYARERMDAWIAANPDAAAPILADVRALQDRSEAEVETLRRWIDADVKAPPLKTLQGLIWAEGYARGELTGHVYPDAAAALRLWHAAGLRLFVFSSGSAAAQKLIFGHSDQGDLAPLFEGFFDLSTGPKRNAGSYETIAEAIGLPPGHILFLSDVAEETDAAAAAGMATRLIDRAAGDSFDAIEPLALA